ncbi:hypothetical protein C8R47DRAFT_1084165 [Mycena vitilis]|nr:hypothetical protein C8R47DRAFT_1084165 [Mycena vitilis]
MFVTLNGEVPLEKEPPRSDGEDGAVEWQGFYRGFDWAMSPDHFLSAQPHKAYMPVADGKFLVGNSRDWVFTWNAAMETSQYAPYRFLTREGTNIRAATQEAWQWTSQVAKQFPDEAQSQPPWPDLTPLTRTCNERVEFNAAVWRMRRGVLECYGYISRVLLQHADWRTKPWAASFVEEVEAMGLLDGPKRGVFLAVTELSEGLVKQLIAHRVPVHYRWRFRPPLGREFFAYSPIAISAFDYVSRQAQAQAAWIREREAKRVAGRNQQNSRSTGGRPAQKSKKRWYKVTDDDPDTKIAISAAEGKRLSELYKVDTSLSTDYGEVAVIHEGELWDEGDDDDEDTSMYLAPAPAVPAPIAVAGSGSQSATPAEEWPALPGSKMDIVEELPGPGDGDMEVDEDCVSLGEELEDGMVVDEPENTVESAPATAQQTTGAQAPGSPKASETAPAFAERMSGDSRSRTPECASSTPRPPATVPSPASASPAFAQRMAGADANTPPYVPSRERSPPRAPRMDRQRFQRDAGWAGARRLHDVGGGNRRDDVEDARYRPYNPRGQEAPRRRSPQPVVCLPRAAPPAAQPPPSVPLETRPSLPPQPRPAPDALPAAATATTSTPAVPRQQPSVGSELTAADVAAMQPEAARQMLLANLSAASAQKLISVLVDASGVTVAELLTALSNPDGPEIEAAPRTMAAPPPPSQGGTEKVSQSATSLEARLGAEISAPTHTPLVARLGVPLEERLSEAESSNASLLARLTDTPGVPQTVREGAAIACSGWIRAMLTTEDRRISDESAFSKAPSIIAPPAMTATSGLTISWESRAELRVRRWLMERTVDSVLSSVVRAFRLGCTFQIWTAAPPGWRPSATTSPHFPQLPRLPHKSGAKYWSADALAQYQSNVAVVLSRIHARGALTAGSVLWRIALEWGPRWLVDNLLQEADPTLGRVEYDAVHHRYAYTLSSDEVDALLGVAVGSSSDGAPTLWPPVEMFHRSNWSMGQWNQRNESWFVQHAAEIVSLAPNMGAKARGKWRSQC